MKPDYRLRIEIYDDECGEIISRSDEPLLSSDVENTANVYRVIRNFDKKREAHEETYYPKEMIES
jgi:hypothetical protein